MFVSGGKQFHNVLTLGQLDTIIFIFGSESIIIFHDENTFYLLDIYMDCFGRYKVLIKVIVYIKEVA
jgi:hypothetical protein